MDTRTPIPVEEYLRTSYRPDCDYVDGEVLERSPGGPDHAQLQSSAAAYFHARRDISVRMETRVWVRKDRVLVSDICVFLGDVSKNILALPPPFLCIEIITPEDRFMHLQRRITDYLQKGVPYVWALDPARKEAFAATADTGFCEIKSGVLATENPTLDMPLSEVFA